MPVPIIKQRGVWAISITIVIVSIGLEFYGRACGFLTTSDSLQYLSAAKSFIESGKFLSPDGSYYSYWPPLFPIILSPFNQPLFALTIINIVCKIILLWVLLRISDSFIQDPILKIIFLIASLIGVHITMISVFVWSELIFMTLIFLNTYCALQIKKHRSYFYWLLLTGFLACVQRNAGLFWICGVCLWLLLDSSLSLKRRIIESGICFFVCTSGMWAWNIYNTFLLPADFNFYKHDFFSDLFYNLKLTLSTFGKMIVPLKAMTMITGVLFFIILLLQWFLKMRENRNVQFLGIVLVLYILGYLVMPRLDIFELDRYFSVITPIAYLFILLMVQEVIHFTKRSMQILIYTMVALWLCYPLTRTFINVKAWHERSCQGKTKLSTIDSDFNERSNSGSHELTFEFRLQNDSVGQYFSRGYDFPLFITTDSSGNIPYDTTMHKYLTINGGGCYADMDERFTFLETPIRFSVFDGIRFITSINNYNIFIVPNRQIGDKEFLFVIDSNGLLKSFIEVKHSFWRLYCSGKRNFKILDNKNDFSVEFQDYVSRKDPDFENEINGILLVNSSGQIVIKYNEVEK